MKSIDIYETIEVKDIDWNVLSFGFISALSDEAIDHLIPIAKNEAVKEDLGGNYDSKQARVYSDLLYHKSRRAVGIEHRKEFYD